MVQVRIGMARCPFECTFFGRVMPCHDPLEAVACYFDDGATRAAIVGLDMTFMSQATAHAIRAGLAQRCGLPAETIVLHSTHTHTGPWDADVRGAGVGYWVERFGDLMDDARRRAEPAEMAYAEADTGRRFNVNRRQALPGVGTLCIHMGLRMHERGPDAGWINRLRIGHWLGRPIDEPGLLAPMIYDRPTDGRVQAVLFRAESGRAIGSIVRYSAHPAVAGHTARKMLSADWPGVLRARLGRAFGGECCFLNGPCGNLTSLELGEWATPSFPAPDQPVEPGVAWMPFQDPEHAWVESSRIGNALADAIEPHLPSSDGFRPCRALAASLERPTLQVRADLLRGAGEASRLRDAALAELARARSTLPPSEVKRLTDRISFLGLTPLMTDWFRLSDEVFSARRVQVDLPALRLDDVVLMGFPGETFWETPQAAARAAGARGLHFISYTEANGDIGYIPTESERAGGDYEVNCSILADGAEATLARHAAAMVGRMR